MKPTVNPNGFYRIDLWHGCYLLLSAEEYYRGLKRAKSEKRRQANEKRRPEEGNILSAFRGRRDEQ